MIVLEHTLIMLLLLINLLRTRLGNHPSLRWVIVGVILLAFLAPSPSLALPWGLFSSIFIPILLWQSAQHLSNAGWFGGSRDFVVWLVLTLGIAGALFFTGGLPVTSSLLFGLLAASFVWNTINQAKKETLLGNIGVLTLVFLLTGIEAAIEAPGQFLLALFFGSVIGSVVGYLAVLIAGRLQAGLRRDLLSIVQIYIGYGIGLLTGMSAVAAAVLSIAVYVAYGIKRGVWADGQINPKPFEQKAIFIIGVAALAFFGWQTHIPFTFNILLEVALVLILTTIVLLLARRAENLETGIQNNLQDILFRVGFLLAAALLLWPKSMLIDSLPLVVALAFASMIAVVASVVLNPMIQLLSWLDEVQSQTVTVNKTTAPTLRVEDFMRNEFTALPPDTPVEQIPAVLSAGGTGCVFIIDQAGKLMGMITEADLFMKEERLPRTDVTYLALFRHPVQPEYILESYNSIRGRYRASDIMSQPVVTIKPDQTIGQTIHLFVKYGYKIIPVVNRREGTEEQVIGMLTRTDLIQYFLGSSESPGEKLPSQSLEG